MCQFCSLSMMCSDRFITCSIMHLSYDVQALEEMAGAHERKPWQTIRKGYKSRVKDSFCFLITERADPLYVAFLSPQEALSIWEETKNEDAPICEWNFLHELCSQPCTYNDDLLSAKISEELWVPVAGIPAEAQSVLVFLCVHFTVTVILVCNYLAFLFQNHGTGSE